ncbi:hypothetical protein [Chthoniobacter flavus]|uniref:hypothetical protein n=1 Tax=Chthoniobacter flavus TaxID=191863 RepID=UPI0002ECD7AE|nr:hypothetical protein [Chthoniobacter flavus]
MSQDASAKRVAPGGRIGASFEQGGDGGGFLLHVDEKAEQGIGVFSGEVGSAWRLISAKSVSICPA